MKDIERLVASAHAKTRPADATSIALLEKRLGFSLSDEYREYLSAFGVIVHGAHELYGLGVPDDYYLNVFKAYADLSRDPAYPARNVPLMEIGDGQYYLYDNGAAQVVQWATPNGGVVKVVGAGLESFIAQYVFGGE